MPTARVMASTFLFWGAVLLHVSGRSAIAATNSASPGLLEQRAGDLGLVLQVRTNGIQVQNLSDLGRGQELLASNSPPLFTLILRQGEKEVRLDADSGWQKVSSQKLGGTLTLAWEAPVGEGIKALSVTAAAVADDSNHALRWSLRVQNKSTNWSIWRVIFPQVRLRDLGEKAVVFFPRGPGEVQENVWRRPFKYRGNYPGGWCSMQFMAAYQENEQPTGLYLAVHDSWGSTKDLILNSDTARHSVDMAFDHPAPNMGRAGNEFELSGKAVWQLLRGDWFDAAWIYKSWARQEARWWPQLGIQGRSDTPLWMRQLNLWTQSGGAPAECVTGVQRFQNFFCGSSDPVGFHWYSWHRIPFDNDYPHYFPAKDKFAAGVAELQQAKVHVMPYINGRLWDTHDRGVEDFEFTRVALPAASKQRDGKPYVESYGSKETNGEPVRLAVMCPATSLWQRKVHDTVSKLLSEVGTSSVYIDQIAAAPPTLCMDRSHGHPLGGGHWWNEGYWTMLESIRRDMPQAAMLTTECNGEPFIRWLDGYLTWHWQSDGQVPAFPAVYGGTIQMFGRAYRGGATKDLAFRMKAAQQLVFGEQIGWMDPGVTKEPANADFLKRVVAVRRRFGEYFYAGEMARPPKLQGQVPKVKADWQWSGEWWVTTDAVLTGAWRLPQTGRLLLLFVNVSDQSVKAKPLVDLAAYGIQTAPSEWFASDRGLGTALEAGPAADFGTELTIGPQQIQAIRW